MVEYAQPHAPWRDGGREGLIARGVDSGMGGGFARAIWLMARWRRTLSAVAWVALAGFALIYLSYLLVSKDQLLALLPKVTVQPQQAAPIVPSEATEIPNDIDALRSEVADLRLAVRDLRGANEALRRRLAELQSALGPATSSLSQRPLAAQPKAVAQAPAKPPIIVTMLPLPEDGFGDTRIDVSPLPIADGAAPTKTLFAVEIATGKSVDSLKRRWKALQAEHGDLVAGLEARQVETAEGPPSSKLRLLAGPFANAAEAARLCVRLKAAKLACSETIFAGDKL